jgi:CxxC-x17-CxxC domain-containing protein
MEGFNRGGDRRGGGGFRGGFGGPREMHKATCSDCGGECEVPFKPAEGRPVFCKDCFAKKRTR